MNNVQRLRSYVKSAIEAQVQVQKAFDGLESLLGELQQEPLEHSIIHAAACVMMADESVDDVGFLDNVIESIKITATPKEKS